MSIKFQTVIAYYAVDSADIEQGHKTNITVAHTTEGYNRLSEYFVKNINPPNKVPGYEFFLQRIEFQLPDGRIVPYNRDSFRQARADWRLGATYCGRRLRLINIIQRVEYNDIRPDFETSTTFPTMISDNAYSRFMEVLKQADTRFLSKRYRYVLDDVYLRHKTMPQTYELLTNENFKRLDTLKEDYNVVSIYKAEPIKGQI